MIRSGTAGCAGLEQEEMEAREGNPCGVECEQRHRRKTVWNRNGEQTTRGKQQPLYGV